MHSTVRALQQKNIRKYRGHLFSGLKPPQSIRDPQIQFLYCIHSQAPQRPVLPAPSAYRYPAPSPWLHVWTYLLFRRILYTNTFFLPLSELQDQTAVHPEDALRSCVLLCHGHIQGTDTVLPSYHTLQRKSPLNVTLHNKDNICHPVLLSHPAHTGILLLLDFQDHPAARKGFLHTASFRDHSGLLTIPHNLPYKIHLHCKNRGNHKYTLFRQIREVLRQVQTPKTEDKDLLPVFCS